MLLQDGLFKGDDLKNDKARREGQAESVLQAELGLQRITSQRRATRRLERALASCVVSGAMKQGDAVSVLVGVVYGF